jgi:hypothetical protein
MISTNTVSAKEVGLIIPPNEPFMFAEVILN